MESRTFSVYSTYLPHDTPPHTVTYHHSWPDQLAAAPESPPSSSHEDNVFLMQHLRFPTPPITPPRAPAPATPPGRTQSVIMRVVRPNDYNHRPHHVPSCPEMETDQQQLLDHATATASSRSESSSSPSCDHVCDWEDCGRCFDSLDSLAVHVTKLHAVVSLADGLYYCRWAGCQRSDRGFNARYKMLVHVRTHTKEKPHQCHLCQKSFSRAENLKIHIRSHSGERPYVCNFEGCSKKYSNSSDRFKHHRTHSMEKPYVCKVPGCMKRYTDPSSLRKHVKTFKHEIQLRESSTALLATASHESSGDQDQSRCYQSYIEMADTSDACHFGAPKLEYYDSEPYWLTASRFDSDIAPCQPRYSLHPDDDYNAMAMNLEMPLDLRVIRRS